jgi:putative ATPase
MKDLDYGAGYRYDPDADGGVAAQTYLPESLSGARFYEPGEEGREPEIGRRLDRARQLRSAAGAGGDQEWGGTNG